MRSEECFLHTRFPILWLACCMPVFLHPDSLSRRNSCQEHLAKYLEHHYESGHRKQLYSSLLLGIFSPIFHPKARPCCIYLGSFHLSKILAAPILVIQAGSHKEVLRQQLTKSAAVL